MFRPRKPSRFFQPLVKRGCRQGSEQSKDGQAGRPSANLLERAFGHADRVIIHAKDERSDRVDVAMARLWRTAAYSSGLLKPLFTLARLAGSMDSMPMKIHRPPEAAIRSRSSSSRNRLALICATQCTWALAAMMSRKSDLVRFTLMAKLSSIKKTAIWPSSLCARAFNRSSSSTTLSLLRKRMESPKKPVTVQNSQP